MIDRAAILMEQGASIACHRVEGMNDNMSHSITILTLNSIF